jgi:protein O-mannosyl-transferase
LLLGWLVISTGNRGGSAGLGTRIGSWEYLCTQFGAIVHYLRLCLWPHPLVLDYGMGIARGAMQIVPYAILVGLLGVATVVAIWRWPKVGFLGAWFFAMLAPASSVVPVATQTIAEHRMYLPLAAVVTIAMLGGWSAGQWLVRCGRISQLTFQVAGGSLAVFVGVMLGILTAHRNTDYQSELSIWEDTVAKLPNNERAQYNFGITLARDGRTDEAVGHFYKAMEIAPHYADPHCNLAVILLDSGHVDEATLHFQKALEIKPDYAEAHLGLGSVLEDLGRIDEAMAHYRQALEIKPDYAEAHYNLGAVLAGRGRLDEAIAQYEQAVEIEPDFADAHNNLANALVGRGRLDEAIAHYRKVLEIKPDFAEVHNNLGLVLVRRDQLDDAIAHFRKALEIKPDFADAHRNLAIALRQKGPAN